MLTKARSILASNSEASRLVGRGKRFSIRLPLAGEVPVPPPDQLAFYGALGALAAIGLIDWPVAAAIGVGQVVVARHLGETPAAPPLAAPAAGNGSGTPSGETATPPASAAPDQAPEHLAP
jgi:hypothetical protein